MSQDGWGPEVVGGRRPRRVLRRLVRGLLALALILVLVAVGMGVWASAQLPRERVGGLAASGSPLNVLVLGSDGREDLTAEQRRELGVGSAPGQRADTIFVMSVSGGRVAMLALPRDLWVTRCDGSTGRINAAISAGAGCMVETVASTTGLPIHHVAQITFDGFHDVVDAVGGVEMCLEEAIVDDDAHIDLPAGCQRLDGDQALGYVRVRKIDNDIARIGRQQAFVRALAGEILEPTTLLNPVRSYSLASEIGDAVTVDHRLGPIDLARLGWAGRGLAAGETVTHTAPVVPANRGGAEVLDLEQPAADALFERFRSGAVFDELSDDQGVEPGDVRVSVRNGAQVTGLAGRTREALEARGYQVLDIGNAEPRTATVIRFPSGQRAAAELLAGEVPGEVDLQEAAGLDHLELLLGRDSAG